MAAGFAGALVVGTFGVTAAAAQPGPPSHAGPPAHAGGPPAHAGPPAADDDVQEDYEVLVVGKTMGFRHANIDDGTHAIIALGEEYGFSVDVWDPPNDVGGWWGDGSPGQPDLTLDETPFTSAEDLARYGTIVFMSPVDNTNDQDPDNPRLLDDDELEAFQGYIRNGGGFAGIHAATDTMHNVPWFSELTGGGARFLNHPPGTSVATKWVEDLTHPSTEMLPVEWERRDEWYNFTENPRDAVHVLINLDETTYDPGSGAMGDHPIAWCHNFEGGKSWYTAGGHTEASFSEPLFLEHVLGGIEWSAGVAGDEGDCTTYDEVREILDGISQDHPRDRNAVRNITRHLDRAQDHAADHDHEAAARSLRTAGNLARALPTDADVSDALTVRLAGLAERELATDM
jgi:type 1 glutamine amidotransferase